MDELERLRQHASEAAYALELYFPDRTRKPNEALKTRYGKDPTVVKTTWSTSDEVVIRTDYALCFTNAQEAALIDAYGRQRAQLNDESREQMADIFVGVLEKWANTMYLYDVTPGPQPQKSRRVAIEQVKLGLFKIDEALSKLDLGAYSHWYSHVMKASADAGIDLRNQKLEFAYEVVEFRAKARKLLECWAEATRAAAQTLPLIDLKDYDKRMRTAICLQDLIYEHKIPFQTTEKGFPAVCLRAVFELAGVEVEKVSYWLKEAALEVNLWPPRSTDLKNVVKNFPSV
jgi:hypothetical protein